MVKKVFFSSGLSALSFFVYARDLQLHFDSRHALHPDKISEKITLRQRLKCSGPANGTQHLCSLIWTLGTVMN
jgi:hypothetical protein